jgi:hypothetical protein
MHCVSIPEIYGTNDKGLKSIIQQPYELAEFNPPNWSTDFFNPAQIRGEK